MATDLDSLRRRLYVPGATAEDVERYRSAVEAAEPPPPEPPIRPPTRRRPVALLGAIVVAAIVVVVGSSIARPAPEPPAAVSAPLSEALPVTVGQRSEFVRLLRSDLMADLRYFLYLHPGARPTALNGVTRVDSAEYSHRGAGAVELDPSSLAARGGHVTLIITTSADGDGRWLLDRQGLREDSRGLRQVIAGSTFGLTAGAPESWTAAYISAPERLTVTVPARTRWDAVVVFTD